MAFARMAEEEKIMEDLLMKFEQYGEYKEDLRIKLDLEEFLVHNLLKDLHNTIGYIKKTKPTILNEYIESLTSKMKTNTKKKDKIIIELKFQEYIKPFENLIENQELIKMSFNFFLEQLGITEDKIWEMRSESFTPNQMHQSANGFYNYQLKTLIEILGKDEAIDYYKKIILNYIHTYDTNQMNIYDSLEELRESTIRFLEKGTLGRVRLISEVEDGRLIEICKNCEKVDFLDKSLREDGDLLFAICCDVHIPLAKMWNENFVLTMDYTISRGYPYCTNVYHDRRLVDKIEQPPKEFYDEIISNFE